MTNPLVRLNTLVLNDNVEYVPEKECPEDAVVLGTCDCTWQGYLVGRAFDGSSLGRETKANLRTDTYAVSFVRFEDVRDDDMRIWEHQCTERCVIIQKRPCMLPPGKDLLIKGFGTVRPDKVSQVVWLCIRALGIPGYDLRRDACSNGHAIIIEETDEEVSADDAIAQVATDFGHDIRSMLAHNPVMFQFIWHGHESDMLLLPLGDEFRA